jgi:hypothetical protein
MKISKLIKEHGWDTFSESDGGCACGSAYMGGIHIETKCHRGSSCNEHEYACVHVWGDDPLFVDQKEIKRIAKYVSNEIKENYMCQCDIGYEEIKN